MTIATDFAATMNMEGLLKDNCAVPMHAVLAIYFCYSGHRSIEYTNNDGSIEMKQLINTEIFQFIGDCTSKGKSHDHAYHTQCYIKSDNCGAQYKCRQLFWLLQVCAMTCSSLSIL